MADSINLRNKLVPSKADVFSAEDYQNSAYYLADNPEYYEPQRGNSFKFVVDLNKILDAAKLRGIYNVTTHNSNPEKALELSIKASSVPHFELDKITINRGNSKANFAGKPTFNDGTLAVHDYIGAHTKEILMAWQSLAYNVHTDKVGLAKDYKTTATLYELTPDYQIVRQWSIVGCWIRGISEGNYDHESADARLMDAAIVYDKAFLESID